MDEITEGIRNPMPVQKRVRMLRNIRATSKLNWLRNMAGCLTRYSMIIDPSYPVTV